VKGRRKSEVGGRD